MFSYNRKITLKRFVLKGNIGRLQKLNKDYFGTAKLNFALKKTILKFKNSLERTAILMILRTKQSSIKPSQKEV